VKLYAEDTIMRRLKPVMKTNRMLTLMRNVYALADCQIDEVVGSFECVFRLGPDESRRTRFVILRTGMFIVIDTSKGESVGGKGMQR
jgi:hypothetical protein